MACPKLQSLWAALSPIAWRITLGAIASWLTYYHCGMRWCQAERIHEAYGVLPAPLLTSSICSCMQSFRSSPTGSWSILIVTRLVAFCTTPSPAGGCAWTNMGTSDMRRCANPQPLSWYACGSAARCGIRCQTCFTTTPMGWLPDCLRSMCDGRWNVCIAVAD